MNKLLFTLMLLLSLATASVQAQERTQSPSIEYVTAEYLPGSFFFPYVAIYCDEPEAELFYQIIIPGGDDYSAWQPYTGPMEFHELGEYQVCAYAVAPGKLESYITGLQFVVTEADLDPETCSPTRIFDFKADGIYYKILSDSTVSVCLNDDDPMPLQVRGGHHHSGVINIPESVVHGGTTYVVECIDWNAFLNCELTSITIPNTVKSIRDGAFYNTTIASGNLYIPASVSTIETAAFVGCRPLVNVQVDESNPVYDSRDNCNAIIETATNTLVSGFECSTIPPTVTAIGDNAFGGSLYALGAPLTRIDLSDQVTTIGDYAFYFCGNLKTATLGNSLTSIGNYAFLGTVLRDVVLPGSLLTIGNSAFAYCGSLASITCHAATPPSCSYLLDESYQPNEENYQQVKLFVPNESLEAYRAHEEWGRFSNIVPFLGAGPGDANGDGVINVSDVTSLIDLLLSGEDEPAWVDVNGDGVVNVSDVTTLIDQLLAGD